MKIENNKHFVRSMTRFTVLFIALSCVIISLSGCAILSLILSEGPFEKGMPPAYDLQEQQERKVLVWIECPRSANADFDLKEKMATAFQLYLVGRAGFDSENIIQRSVPDGEALLLDPKKIARSQGAGYLLLVQVDKYEVDYLQVRNYFAGEMISRAVLYDVESGETLWPSQPEGKMVHVVFEMESEGRDALVNRLTSTTAHCVSRNLYPCEKLKYKTAGERVSSQEAFEIETY